MSLTGCLKKAGDAINKEDRAAIMKESARLRREEKLSADDAARKAVDSIIAGIKAKLAEQGEEPAVRFMREANPTEAAALQKISSTPEFFVYPKSSAKTVEAIAKEIDPRIKVDKRTVAGETMFAVTFPEGIRANIWERFPSEFGPHPYEMELVDGTANIISDQLPGENASYLPEEQNEVYIDVSKMQLGESGAKIYAIATAYAHNTGALFIGDPNGLTDIALRRRTEHMLSSALKYGTTDHLAPHPYQVRGNKAIGVPPLKWVYGDHIGNIHRMIDVVMESVDNSKDGYQPRFDEPGGNQGAENDAVVQLESRSEPGDAQSGMGSAATAIRGGAKDRASSTQSRRIVLSAALRGARRESEAGGGRNAVLARLNDVGREQRRVSGSRQPFYALADGGSRTPVFTAAQLKPVAEALAKGWKNAPPINVIETIDDAPAVVVREAKKSGTDDVLGFFYDNQIYIVASNAQSMESVMATVFHEALGHYGLQGAFGDALNTVLDDVIALRPKQVKAKAAAYGLNWNDRTQRRIAAEEVLAELAQSYPNIKEKGLIRRAIEAIRAWLAKHFPDLVDVSKIPDDYLIRNFIIPAREWVINGKTAKEKPDYVRYQRGTTTGERGDARSAINAANNQNLGGNVQRDAATQERAVRAETSGSPEPAPMNEAAASRAENSTAKFMAQRYFDDYEKRADQVQRAIEQMGLTARRESSRISQSEYVEIESPDYTRTDGMEGETLKIRVSDHALPRGYTQPDFDVIADGKDHRGLDFNNGGTWIEAVKWVADKWNLPLPATVKAVESRALTQQQKDALKARRLALAATEKRLQEFDELQASGKLIAKKSNSGVWRVGEDPYNWKTEIPLGRPSEPFSKERAFELARNELSAKVDAASKALAELSPAPNSDGATNPDIRFMRVPQQSNLELQGGQTGSRASWDAPEPSKMDNVIYVLQDKMIDLKRAVVAIKNARQQLADEWNPYLKEEMFHGRSAKRTTDFIKNELTPLLEALQAKNIALADFEKYLHARHAEERNVRIAEINPDMPDGGSGMMTADAKAYLAGLSNKPELEALAKRVDSITKKTRETLRDYGLVSNGEIEEWTKLYPNYVPLMRDEEGGRGTGQGFSIKGQESKRAMGSMKEVKNILANIAMQRERAIVRGEKNRVATALYGLAKLNPNREFWETDKPPMMQYIGKDGLVDSMVDPNYKNRDNVVIAKIYHAKTDKVTEHAVIFNEDNERAMRTVAAWKNLDGVQFEWPMAAVAKATRFLASINTQYNPIFGVVNLVRDVQGAAFNLTTTPLADKKAAVLKEVPAALRAVYREERGKEAKSTYAALWDDFQNVGGQTGYRDMYANPKDRADALQSEIKKITEGKLKSAGRAVFDWLSDYNQAMENGVRLAAYKVALDQGMTKEQAASVAKNLTVNFNRKGQIGQQAGALYAFFNASVQGTARLAETLTGKAGKRILAGGLLLGVIQALALSGNDEDDPPQFEREKNLIIPLGDKKYVKIPMPLGLHVIPNTSRILTEMHLHGDYLKRTGQLLGGLVDAFNPTGSVGLSTQTILPTVVDPFAALGENRDWMGRKIYREDLSSLAPTPGHSRSKDVASWPSQQLAIFMNWATGGTEFVKGGFSPTADQIDYLVGQVTGGVGREILKTTQTGQAIYTGEDLPAYKIPLAGRFYGEADSPASVSGKFYRNLVKQNEHEATIKGLYKSGRDASDYIRANPDSNLFAMANAYQRAVSQIQQQKRDETKRGAPREEIKAIEKRAEEMMRQFNEEVERARKAASQ